MTVLAHEALGVDGVLANAAFLVGRGDAEDIGPLGPGVLGSTGLRGAGNDLELVDALAAVAMHRSQAIGAGVSAANDNHMFVFRREEFAMVGLTGDAPVLHGQEGHGRVDAAQLAALDGQVAGRVAPPQRQTASNRERSSEAGR